MKVDSYTNWYALGVSGPILKTVGGLRSGEKARYVANVLLEMNDWFVNSGALCARLMRVHD